MHFQFRLIPALVLVAIVIAGCRGAAPLKSELVPTSSSTGFTLDTDIEYSATRGVGVRWTEGLKAGQYVAFAEDDKGILYKGPDRCVMRKMNGGDLGPNEGGIWLPKVGRSEKPRLWYYFSTTLPDDAYSHEKLGLAGGMVVAAIFAANEGNLEYWIPIEDSAFLSKIKVEAVAAPAPKTAEVGSTNN